jgi:hypothetical protein
MVNILETDEYKIASYILETEEYKIAPYSYQPQKHPDPTTYYDVHSIRSKSVSSRLQIYKLLKPSSLNNTLYGNLKTSHQNVQLKYCTWQKGKMKPECNTNAQLSHVIIQSSEFTDIYLLDEEAIFIFVTLAGVARG